MSAWPEKHIFVLPNDTVEIVVKLLVFTHLAGSVSFVALLVPVSLPLLIYPMLPSSLCISICVSLPSVGLSMSLSLYFVSLILCVSLIPPLLHLPIGLSLTALSLCLCTLSLYGSVCLSLVPPLLHLPIRLSLMSLGMPLFGTGIRLHVLSVLLEDMLLPHLATFSASLKMVISVLTLLFILL